MTVAELDRMYDAYAWRRSDEMAALAVQTYLLRSMLDGQSSLDQIRDAFGWKEREG